MNKDSNMMVLLKGLIRENPVFVLVLGTCPTLATTSTIIGAISMGLAATAVLMCSNAAVSLLRKLIPDTVRIPCYIVIIAAFVTLVQMFMHAYLPELYELLGVYLALITVNCIVLGRAEMYASKNTVGKSVLDGLGMGLGFTLALLLMSLVRETLGAGTFCGMEIPFIKDHTIGILGKAPGGLMVYGLLIFLVSVVTGGKAPGKKSFSCQGCPASGNCMSCDKKEAE